MSLLEFFEWCETTSVATVIKNSSWAFAVIESVHLLSLALIGGAILILNLRLLGLGLRRHPVQELARDIRPWFTGSLIVMLFTGVALFLSEALKCYYSPAFWLKMVSLLLAVIFTVTIYRRIVMEEGTSYGPRWQKAAALVSLLLWSSVGAAGRWIGFS